MKVKWIKLPNGTMARADLIAGVSYHEETRRLFLKNADGDTLCSCICTTGDEAEKVMAGIDAQLS